MNQKIRRLKFEIQESPIHSIRYNIWNDKEEFLGAIAKQRVGAYMHWCFFPEQLEEIGDLWFTAGCMDEIRQFMKNPQRAST